MALQDKILDEINETGEEKNLKLFTIENFIKNIHKKLAKYNFKFFQLHTNDVKSMIYIDPCDNENLSIKIVINNIEIFSRTQTSIIMISDHLNKLTLKTIEDIYDLINKDEKDVDTKIG